MRDLCLSVGNSGNLHDPNKRSSGKNTLKAKEIGDVCKSESTQESAKWCCLSNQGIECAWLIVILLKLSSNRQTSRQQKEFCFNRTPGKGTWCNTSTLVIDSMLKSLPPPLPPGLKCSSDQAVHIYCNLEWFVSTV